MWFNKCSRNRWRVLAEDRRRLLDKSALPIRIHPSVWSMVFPAWMRIPVRSVLRGVEDKVLDFLQQLRQPFSTTCVPIVRLCRSFDRMGDKNSLGRSKDKSFSLAAAGSWLPRNVVDFMLLMLLFIVTLLLFIPVLVVDAYERAAEGEYLAKGDEDGVMNLAQWRANEAR